MPVEIGSTYLSEDAGEELLTINEFIDRFIVGSGESESSEEQSAGSGGVGYLAQHQLLEQIPELKNDRVVPDYCVMLMPEDEEDEEQQQQQQEEEREVSDGNVNTTVAENAAAGAAAVAAAEGCAEDPIGCSCGNNTSETILEHAFFGPVGTASPLHHDPYHNLLVQVAGTSCILCQHGRIFLMLSWLLWLFGVFHRVQIRSLVSRRGNTEALSSPRRPSI